MSRVSFVGLVDAKNVRRIEIPMIQRDYAQGRDGALSVRDAFLDVLRDAVTGVRRVHLDFVYGEIIGDKLVPLDGQQRLTALFLLHWYVAARAGITTAETSERLPALTYEIRHSSRVFSKHLSTERPTFPLESHPLALSRWIVDRSWFVSAWRHDPTILSMLVVLNAIHARLRDADAQPLWERLTDASEPPITFDFLPIENLGLTDELYVKMNSRGKPLTPFENFKAAFEEMVRGLSEDLRRNVARKLDNDWCDVFWRLRGADNAIDARFLSYFLFATDVIAHRTGRAVRTNDGALARARGVFGHESADAADNLRSLMSAFDIWVSRDVPKYFDSLFTNATHEPGKVALYDNVQLFDACCREFDQGSFSLAKQILLFAVIRHLATASPDFEGRMRTLRNLAANSSLRSPALPEMLGTAERIVANGLTSDLTGFDRRQTDEEVAKATLVSDAPDLESPLRRLEDHPLLRGCLASFDLDASTLARRAAAFVELFAGSGGVPSPRVQAALLACGHYARNLNYGRFQLGTGSRELWREFLTGANVSRVKQTLTVLLDAIGTPADGSLEMRVEIVVTRYLGECESKRELGWRYYFVKYDCMRSSASGIYASAGHSLGFDICMLNKTRLTGWFQDPYLTAIFEAAGRPDGAIDPWFKQQSAQDPRWLDVASTEPGAGAGMRCIDEGLALRRPTDPAAIGAFDVVAKKYEADDAGIIRVPQLVGTDGRLDSVDRIALGARILTDLVAATQPGGDPAEP